MVQKEVIFKDGSRIYYTSNPQINLTIRNVREMRG